LLSSDSLDLANSNLFIISSSVYVLDSWSRIKERVLDSKDKELEGYLERVDVWDSFL
jgi:hypothetical protein